MAAALTMLCGAGASTGSVSALVGPAFPEIWANKMKRDAEADEICHFDLECEKEYYKSFGLDNDIEYSTYLMNRENIVLGVSFNMQTGMARFIFNARAYSLGERASSEEPPYMTATNLKVQWVREDGEYMETEGIDLEPYVETEVKVGNPEEQESKLKPSVKYSFMVGDEEYSDGSYFQDCLDTWYYREDMDCEVFYPRKTFGRYQPREQGYRTLMGHEEIEDETGATGPEPDEELEGGDDPDLDSEKDGDMGGGFSGETETETGSDLVGSLGVGEPGDVQLAQNANAETASSSGAQNENAAQKNTSVDVTLKAPDTGVPVVIRKEKTQSFNIILAWLGILVAVDFGLLLWWIKSDRKNRKKSEKSIDKKAKVR